MKNHRQQYVCLFLFFITRCFATNIIPNINLKKPIAVTSNTFLSFTLDPSILQQNIDTSMKVLLNNEPFNLINDDKLPDIKPEIIINPADLELNLSPGDIEFWIIPNGKVETCTYPEEEVIETGTENKLWKRDVIRQSNREERKVDINQTNLRNGVYAKQDKAENEKTNAMPKVWDTKLFNKIKRLLEKRMGKNNPFNLQRSLTIDFEEEQRSLSEEVGEQKNLNVRNCNEEDIKEKFKDIRDTLRKFKYTLPKEKIQLKAERNLEQEIRNINNVVALISKIEILLDEEKNISFDEDEDDDTIASKKKNTHYNLKSSLDHDIEMKDNSKDYDDLLEAKFVLKGRNDENNNNDTIFVIISQQQLEEEDKRARENNVQKLVIYYRNFEKALEHFSKSLDQFSKTTTYTNPRASRMESEEAKLKVESEDSIPFCQISKISPIKYNYGNYEALDTEQDEIKLKEEKDFVNIQNFKDNINMKIKQFSRPVDVRRGYRSDIFHNKRNKRSNLEKLRKILSEEMIREDERNANDCHCRVIRASNSPKKFCHCRVKRDSQILTKFQLPNSSSKAINTNIVQSKRYIRNPVTKEKYEVIMTGEILPNTIESDYDEYNAIRNVKIKNTDSNTFNHNTKEGTIDVASIPSAENSLSENSASLNMSQRKNFFDGNKMYNQRARQRRMILPKIFLSCFRIIEAVKEKLPFPLSKANKKQYVQESKISKKKEKQKIQSIQQSSNRKIKNGVMITIDLV